MLPAQWCDMSGDLVRRAHGGQRLFEITGVLQDDCGDRQVETRGTVGLVLEPAVAQFAELVEEQCPGKRVA